MEPFRRALRRNSGSFESSKEKQNRLRRARMLRLFHANGATFLREVFLPYVDASLLVKCAVVSKRWRKAALSRKVVQLCLLNGGAALAPRCRGHLWLQVVDMAASSQRRKSQEHVQSTATTKLALMQENRNRREAAKADASAALLGQTTGFRRDDSDDDPRRRENRTTNNNRKESQGSGAGRPPTSSRRSSVTAASLTSLPSGSQSRKMSVPLNLLFPGPGDLSTDDETGESDLDDASPRPTSPQRGRTRESMPKELLKDWNRSGKRGASLDVAREVSRNGEQPGPVNDITFSVLSYHQGPREGFGVQLECVQTSMENCAKYLEGFFPSGSDLHDQPETEKIFNMFRSKKGARSRYQACHLVVTWVSSRHNFVPVSSSTSRRAFRMRVEPGDILVAVGDKLTIGLDSLEARAVFDELMESSMSGSTTRVILLTFHRPLSASFTLGAESRRKRGNPVQFVVNPLVPETLSPGKGARLKLSVSGRAGSSDTDEGLIANHWRSRASNAPSPNKRTSEVSSISSYDSEKSGKSEGDSVASPNMPRGRQFSSDFSEEQEVQNASVASRSLKRVPGLYQALLSTIEAETSAQGVVHHESNKLGGVHSVTVWSDIDLDVRRTVEAGSAMARRLRDLLRATAAFFPKLGYCQGLNYVGRFILDSCGEDDEGAFWLMAAALTTFDITKLYEPGMSRVHLCYFQLDRLLRFHFPSLWGHFKGMDVSPDLYATSWFITLFTDGMVLPVTGVERVWDALFAYDGCPSEQWALIFRVILWTLSVHEENLLQLRTFESCVGFLHRMPVNSQWNTLRDFGQILEPHPAWEDEQPLADQLTLIRAEYDGLLPEQLSTSSSGIGAGALSGKEDRRPASTNRSQGFESPSRRFPQFRDKFDNFMDKLRKGEDAEGRKRAEISRASPETTSPGNQHVSSNGRKSPPLNTSLVGEGAGGLKREWKDSSRGLVPST